MSRRGRQRFDKLENTYFITTSVKKHLKIFSLSEKYYLVLLDSLKYLLIEHSAKLISYVLMPTHVIL